MKRDFWGIDGEIWGWNRYIISNFHSLHPPPQIQTGIYLIFGGGPIACQDAEGFFTGGFRKQLNRHKVDAKHINFKKKKADGDEDNNEVEAVAE